MNPSEAQERELMEQEMRDLRRRLLILERALDRGAPAPEKTEKTEKTEKKREEERPSARTTAVGLMNPSGLRRRVLIC